MVMEYDEVVAAMVEPCSARVVTGKSHHDHNERNAPPEGARPTPGPAREHLCPSPRSRFPAPKVSETGCRGGCSWVAGPFSGWTGPTQSPSRGDVPDVRHRVHR